MVGAQRLGVDSSAPGMEEISVFICSLVLLLNCTVMYSVHLETCK